MKMTKLTLVPFLIAAFATGCAATDAYDVTGEVTSSATVAGPITLQFYGVNADNTREEADSVEVDALGSFSASIEVAEGSTKVAVMALEDSDNDGACTEGELWGEQEVTPEADGTLPALALVLTAETCPAAAAE